MNQPRDQRLIVVEDRRILAQGLCRAFGSAGIDCRTVTEPSIEAVEVALREFDPHAAIVAMGFGSGSLTEDVVGLLAATGVPVIVMTGGADRLRLARLISEGAVGIADRSVSFETLLGMVRESASTNSLIDPGHRRDLEITLRRHRASLDAARKPFRSLSDRELEVLRALADGHRASEIADRSYVSVSTVRSQIRAVLTKLGVSSQLAAVAMAHRAHIFDPGPDHARSA